MALTAQAYSTNRGTNLDLGLVYAKLGEHIKAREPLSRARQLNVAIGGAEIDAALASLSR